MIGQSQVWYKMISYLALDFLLFTVFIKNRHETNNGNPLAEFGYFFAGFGKNYSVTGTIMQV